MPEPLLLFVNPIRIKIAGYDETEQILPFWILTTPLRDIFLLHLSQRATIVPCPQTSQNVQWHWGKSSSSLYREIPLSGMLTPAFHSPVLSKWSESTPLLQPHCSLSSVLSKSYFFDMWMRCFPSSSLWVAPNSWLPPGCWNPCIQCYPY